MNVRLRGISKAYAGAEVFKDLDLTLPPGNVAALVGVNGAGKTTLLRMLAGLASPDQGKLCFDDEVFGIDRLDLRRRLMFLPDFPSLLPGSPIEVVATSMQLWEKEPGEDFEDRLIDWLGELSLLKLAKMPTQTFSRGQLYKAALLNLLAVDPDLWLLDEPFASGMDPQGLAVLRREMKTAAKERGRTVIYSTQILEIAEQTADILTVVHEDHVETVSRQPDGTWPSGKEAWFESLGSLREKV